jgi:hypothetical protein
MEFKKGRNKGTKKPNSLTGIFRGILLKMEINEETSYPLNDNDFVSMYSVFSAAKREILVSNPERQYVTTKHEEIFYIKRTK